MTFWWEFCEAFPSKRGLARINWEFCASAGNPRLLLRLMGDIFEFRRPDGLADFSLFVNCFPFLTDQKLCALAASVVCRALEVSNVNTAFGAPYRYFSEFCSYFCPERVLSL